MRISHGHTLNVNLTCRYGTIMFSWGRGVVTNSRGEKETWTRKRQSALCCWNSRTQRNMCKPRTKDRARRAVCAAAEAYLFKALILVVDTVKKWSTSTNILAVYSHTRHLQRGRESMGGRPSQCLHSQQTGGDQTGLSQAIRGKSCATNLNFVSLQTIWRRQAHPGPPYCCYLGNGRCSDLLLIVQ